MTPPILDAQPDSARPDARRSPPRPLVLCFSHLRWNFVYQRPQHLMTRFAADHDVLYIEEPLSADHAESAFEVSTPTPGVTVLVPMLGRDAVDADSSIRALLDAYLSTRDTRGMVLWYYTPMSLGHGGHLPASLVVYDCMDELSAFRGAPPALIENERALLARADLVFTGGYSLYEAKRQLHHNVHAFPSSVDVAHFARARSAITDPADQARIAHPRVGFYGVLDERLDIDLLDGMARARPDWQIVMIGPVVKIDPDTLPRHANIHYLGSKSYAELPSYLAGWDAALLLFARNESTRFISPTKTPEYLASGRLVVSTPIADVVRMYGDTPAVRIADSVTAFVAAVDAALEDAGQGAAIHPMLDRALGSMSWDATWAGMHALISHALTLRAGGPRQSRKGVSTDDSYDYLIVGAGFAGSVMAERLAAGLNQRVLVVERRDHIGGNAYDRLDEHGVMVHQYGPHIFHTNSDKVVAYLSRFTEWRDYEHRVLADVDGMLLPMPINLTTLNTLYGLDMTPEAAAAFLAARAEKRTDIRSAEDMVINTVGRELYEKFFRGYTRKQWGLDPSELDRSVTARVPTRTTTDDRYFTDSFQKMPLHGYTRMFEKMLDHPNITVRTSTEYRDVARTCRYRHLVFCGPIDEFFGYRYGRLPYRSLRFEHVTLPQAQFQPVGVVNYPSGNVPYTRITEYKHLTGQTHPSTSLSYEYPTDDGDPYYPVPRPENAVLFQRYQALADTMTGVSFVGRLATYRYYNMDQVVAQALSTFERIAARGQAVIPAAAA
jgi:UDP-galactopyranose mutase